MKSGRNWGRLGMKFDITQLCDVDIEVIDGDRGKNYPHQDELFDSGYCLFLSAKNVTQNGFLFGDNQFITQEKDELLNNGNLIRGDIVITTRGTVGNVAIYSDDVPFDNIRINSGMLIIRCGNNIDNYFLYQVLRSKWFYNQIISIQSGSAQPQLPKSHFLKMTIPMPDMETQRKIAVVLSRLGDKISVNTAINENLEQQAQAIFKSWFVDFEPFGGVMPEDWRTGSLSEICGYSKDKVNIEALTLDTYYSTENMQPNRQGAVQATTLPTIKQTTACKKGNVLISNIRPYFKKIIYCFADCGCSTDVLCFVPNKSEYSAFLYCALYSDKFFDYMVAGSKGTKMPRGDKQQIMMYPICIPSTEYVEQFSKIVAPMFETVYTNRLEANDLAILRDTLLPKLMNGEIDVSKVKI